MLKKKKCFSLDGQTDGRTDTRSTQNYSSEPHKTLDKRKIKIFEPVNLEKSIHKNKNKIKKKTFYF